MVIERSPVGLRRTIADRMKWQEFLLLCVLACVLGSCMLVVSFDEHETGLGVLESLPRFKVTGTVEGLDPGARVIVSHNGGATVEVGNEPFELPETVPDGETYTILVSQPTHACEADPATGRVEGADVHVTVRCLSDDATLRSLEVSKGTMARGAFAPAFDPALLVYRVSLPLLPLTAPAVVAIANNPGATVTVHGVSVGSGTPVPVPVGPVDVKVTSASRRRQASYTLALEAGTAYLKASNTRAKSRFGRSVALSGDTLAVGAWQENSGATGVNGDQADTSAAGAGAVYVFTRTSGVWKQQAYLKASNTREGSRFGVSVALSGDTLAVGAPTENSSATGVNGDETSTSSGHAGAVYVFTRAAGVWAQQAYVKASNTRSAAFFGSSVALSGDTLAVGATGESSNATGVNGDQTDTSAFGAGAAYVFTRTANIWTQQAYLKASNTRANASFGGAVALSGDTLAVGATGESSNATGVNGVQTDTSESYAGAAYVFTRVAGAWAQQAYLKASNTRSSSYFGSSLALSSDTLAVGATAERSSATGVNGDQTDASATSAGAAYVFTRTAGVWTQQAYLKASNTRAGSEFAGAVALSADTLVVGSIGENSDATGVNGDQVSESASGAGAAYVFTRTAGVWTQQAYLKASNTRASSSFGASVALSGDAVAVGAEEESSAAKGVDGDQTDTSATGAGAVYVF